MREIKFRAWFMGDEPLDPDDIAEYEKPQMIYNVHGLYDGMGVNSAVLGGYGSFGGLLEDKRFMVMQYTGLKDKNGKEIYEGDILLDDDSQHGVVKFDDSSAHYFLQYSMGASFIVGVLEVIGNIYEHPELLK